MICCLCSEQMGPPSKVWVFCARITNLRSKEWVYHGKPMQWTYKKSTVLNYGHRRRSAWGEPPLNCNAIFGETSYWCKWTSQMTICNTNCYSNLFTLIFMQNKRLKEFCCLNKQVFSRPVRICFKFTVETLKVFLLKCAWVRIGCSCEVSGSFPES